MPLYDFSCAKCGTSFENNVSFRAYLAEITCPKGHRAVRRIFSTPQVVFKSSGCTAPTSAEAENLQPNRKYN
jgi:putative FmdB family regulatory protein